MRFVALLGLIALSRGFVATSLPRAGDNRAGSLRAQASEPNEERTRDGDGPLDMDGFMRIRERQRARTNGVPVKTWSQSLERQVPEQPDHQPVPPTPEQEAAMNKLFEQQLSETEPDGFGEGLDRLARGDADESMQRPGA